MKFLGIVISLLMSFVNQGHAGIMTSTLDCSSKGENRIQFTAVIKTNFSRHQITNGTYAYIGASGEEIDDFFVCWPRDASGVGNCKPGIQDPNIISITESKKGLAIQLKDQSDPVLFSCKFR